MATWGKNKYKVSKYKTELNMLNGLWLATT